MSKFKLFVSLLFAVSAVTSHAQRINSRGQKMVSRIEIENYQNKQGYVKQKLSILFDYDTGNNLKSITRTVVYNDEEKDITSYGRNHTLKDVLSKNGRSLTRKTYFDNRLNREAVFRYVMDEQGLITDKYETSEVEMGDSLMNHSHFHYTMSDDGYKLSQIEEIQWLWDKGERKWYKLHDYSYINFGYKNGDCYWAMMHSSDYVVNTKNHEGKRRFYGGDIDYKDEMFSSQNDDTNINLNLFVTMYHWEICLDEHQFELSTEWVAMKSKHLVAASGQDKLYFNTHAKTDGNGNISELVVRYLNRENPTKRIKIFYVM